MAASPAHPSPAHMPTASRAAGQPSLLTRAPAHRPATRVRPRRHPSPPTVFLRHHATQRILPSCLCPVSLGSIGHHRPLHSSLVRSLPQLLLDRRHHRPFRSSTSTSSVSTPFRARLNARRHNSRSNRRGFWPRKRQQCHRRQRRVGISRHMCAWRSCSQRWARAVAPSPRRYQSWRRHRHRGACLAAQLQSSPPPRWQRTLAAHPPPPRKRRPASTRFQRI